MKLHGYSVTYVGASPTILTRKAGANRATTARAMAADGWRLMGGGRKMTDKTTGRHCPLNIHYDA